MFVPYRVCRLSSFYWAIIVLIFTIIPGKYIPQVQSFWSLLQWDKLVHIILFSVFVALLINDLRSQKKFRVLQNNSLLFSLLFGTVFGLLTEMIQLIETIQRNSNVYDMIADFTGCLLGIPLYFSVFKKMKNKF